MGAIWSFFISPSYYVNKRRFMIINQINTGAFSFIYLVKFESNYYALKRIPMNLIEHEEISNREIEYMSKLSHPSLIKLIEFEIVQDIKGKEAFIIMNYYKNGSIVTKAGMIKENEIFHAIYNVADAIKYLNLLELPLSHRDIKPENMLISESGRIILTDLGSISPSVIKIRNRQHALELQDQFSLNCTSYYRAPELFDIHINSKITEKTDIWSIGCTLYYLAYKKYLFDGTALSSISCNIHLPEQPQYRSINRIIEMCLKVDHSERCNVEELLNTIRPLTY